VDHYVLWLEVSVDDLLSMALPYPVNNLFQYIHSLILENLALFLYLCRQVVSITILQYHELEIVAFKTLVTVQYVNGVEKHHDSGLGFGQAEFDLSKTLVGCVFDLAHVDHLDGDLHLCLDDYPAINRCE
jgi:hypothetical protein